MGTHIISYQRKMQCFESNVQAAYVLGITLVALNIFSGLSGFLEGINSTEGLQSLISGIVGVLIHGILVYGASKKKRNAIRTWAIIMFIHLIVTVVFHSLVIIVLPKILSELRFRGFSADLMYIAYIGLLVAYFLFNIWVLKISMKAREEIRIEQLKRKENVEEGHEFEEISPPSYETIAGPASNLTEKNGDSEDIGRPNAFIECIIRFCG